MIKVLFSVIRCACSLPFLPVQSEEYLKLLKYCFSLIQSIGAITGLPKLTRSSASNLVEALY